jgi:hypothetical protein
MIALVALLVSFAAPAHGMYYLPGVVPHSYEEKESVCRAIY